MSQLLHVFINVTLPVFGIVALGYLLGARLQLQARTLTRVAYYVFVPAFIFKAIGGAELPLSSTIKMLTFIVLVHLLTVLAAAGIGRALDRPKVMIAAFVMIASFGNVGNYGLAMIHFHLGEAAIAPSTIYFVAVTISAFIICVGAAGWARGGRRGAFWGLLKTPALWAVVPALAVSQGGIEVPLMLSRMIGLLADAMIPVMLFSLGLQLLEQKQVMLSTDVWLASGIRLLLAPALAWGLSIPFHLGHVEAVSGILQSSMPTAVLVAIIAKENDIIPSFVMSVVLVSTLASLITLTFLMVIL
ncbi:MAG: transporter [Desulfuromonas sp.]|nr:MAG: transporter [Desulfuromonas sp.]